MKKKHVVGIVLICICVAISACSTNGDVDGREDMLQATAPSSATPVTATPNRAEESFDADDVNLSGGEVPTFTIESYGEYLEFIAHAELPSDFVPYEAIANLGEFKSFVCLSDVRDNDFSSCMYSLFDESQSEFVLYVDIGNQDVSTVPVSNITAVNSNNMRSLINSTDAGTYIVSGMEYKYIAGKLLSISWSDGNISYTLSGTSMLGDYPENITTTAVGKMMNVQNAKSIIAAIIEDNTAA